MILQMVFSDNYWHGDLHPGNIIVQHQPQVPPDRVSLSFLVYYFFINQSINYWHGDLHPGNIIVQHLPQVPPDRAYLSFLVFVFVSVPDP
jgi:predicted unusual protein kinase regulating ubiquinone biosynthesis (AarF/ABC1/UbiB family)